MCLVDVHTCTVDLSVTHQCHNALGEVNTIWHAVILTVNRAC